jgi:GNAT superfamily N-acetyltransferase
MTYKIRRAEPNDVPNLENMLIDYMRETYQSAWGGNAEQLERDVSDEKFKIFVAESSDRKIIGFIAWVSIYDLHHCLEGGEIIDLFVRLPYRGRGAGVLLITKLAAEIRDNGGAFLHGGAVDNPVVRRFYERSVMCLPGGESYLSGRAFRHLADLSRKSIREIARNLPEAAWNHEP